MTEDAAPPTDPRAHRGFAWGSGLVLLVTAIVVVLLFWRHDRALGREAARRQQQLDRGPRVFVTEARAAPASRVVTLPGNVRGFLQSTVYAKIAGYVKSISVDRGDRVKEGQVLGVLESPEVDQQVAAAEADAAVKKRTFERYQQLVKKDFVSVQDFETARAQYEVSVATAKQAHALRAYGTLRAPFAGVVTARYVDPGALIPAATGSTESALPLVEVADLRRLRVLVFLQQDAAPFVHKGDPVQIRVDEQPDVCVEAPVSVCASALDPRTRTMLCEIWLENEHRVYPGMFVHATFHLVAPRTPVIDSGALVLRHNKPAVAVVRDDRVHFVPVRPGLDDGKTVQIVDGLRSGERILIAPPSELAENDLVQPIERPPPPDAGAAKAGAEPACGKSGG